MSVARHFCFPTPQPISDLVEQNIKFLPHAQDQHGTSFSTQKHSCRHAAIDGHQHIVAVKLTLCVSGWWSIMQNSLSNVQCQLATIFAAIPRGPAISNDALSADKRQSKDFQIHLHLIFKAKNAARHFQGVFGCSHPSISAWTCQKF